jgi:hypothetical protein
MRTILVGLLTLITACGGEEDRNQLTDAPVPPADDDGDGVANSADNCPADPNADQDDNDGDGEGDVCDADDDNDTVDDGDDNCPLDANTDQVDLDIDAQGDACDLDDDNDSFLDTEDNCPTLANDQSDLDADAAGDACDPDDDNDTIADDVDNCPTVTNDQSDVDQDGFGDACDGVIVPVFEGFITGGNITAKGVGWAGRFDQVVDTSVDIVISDLPANAVIRKAFLYWTTIGVAFPTVTMNNTAVTGTEIGTTGDTCWGIGNNFLYRADVTSLVTGNATFTLTNILSALTGPDGQGASLIILYSDPADTRRNFLAINDGAVGFVGNGEVATSVADGFVVPAGVARIRAFTAVADGQPAGDAVSYNGTVASTGDAYQGLEGAMWDTRIDDITALIAPESTSITTSVDGFGDCLAWSFSAISIEGIPAVQMKRAPKASPKPTPAKRPAGVRAPTGRKMRGMRLP